jgi:hypothetical protein
MVAKKKAELLRNRGILPRSKGYYQDLRRALLRKWYNSRLQTRPIFIVGCGRSGTTMLLKQLGTTWQIEAFNEDHPIAFKNWRLERLDIIEEVIKRCPAPIALFKPILSTTQSNEFLIRFPDAKILFVFRNYHDVINSSLKRFGVENRIDHLRSWVLDDFAEFCFAPPPERTKQFIRSLWNPLINPETGAALYWLFYNRLYYDLGLYNDDRVWLVNYENLVQDPQSEFEKITHFIEIPYTGKLIEGVKRHPSPSVSGNVLHACEDLWQTMKSVVP